MYAHHEPPPRSTAGVAASVPDALWARPRRRGAAGPQGGGTVNLAQVEYFTTTAETLSFTKTAELLNVTQQAVSKGIASLEGTLGVSLFERRGGGLALTEDGVRARRHAEDLLRDAARFAETARRDGGGAGIETRTLRLGVSDTLLGDRYTLSLDAVLAFERARGDVRLDISESTSDGCQDMLAAGGVDVIMITGRADYRRFRVRRLEERRFVPFVGLGHRLAGKDAVGIADLAHETFLIPYGATSVIHELCEGFYDAGVEVPSPAQFVCHECSPRLMVERVYHGEGVAIMRDNNLAFIDPARGKALDVADGSFKARLSAATLRGVARDPLVAAFVEHLVGCFGHDR